MTERRERTTGKDEEYVIGAPDDRSKLWEYGNRNRAAADLYREIAATLQIDVMESERSHMWRITLRSFRDGKVPPAVLNSQIGHSEKSARKHYTDASDFSASSAPPGWRPRG